MDQNLPTSSNSIYYFVLTTIDRIKKDKGCRAALRMADNPIMEYKSWEYLANFNIDLRNSLIRVPYVTIASAISKIEPLNNGTVGIGKAIASCYLDGNKSDQAKAKMRRLLACDSLEEACRILRPLFSLIQSKSCLKLNYAYLLKQLLNFHWNDQSIKSDWAQDFYSSSLKKEIEE